MYVGYCQNYCVLLTVHVGDKSAAIDFYSKAVTELENGVSCTVNVKGWCRECTEWSCTEWSVVL